MPRPDVILIGASVRSFAQSALCDGIRPVCVDMFCDADLRASLRESGLAEAFWCRRVASFTDVAGAVADVDPNVPAIVLGGLENHETSLQQLSEQRAVLGPDWNTIRQLRNPQRLFLELRDRGCCIPRCVVKGQERPTHQPGMRWLRKDRLSSGGQGIRWHVDSDESPRQQSETVLTDDLQEFIDGIPISASFLAVAGPENESANPQHDAVLLGCALQLSGCHLLHAADFHFCGNVGPLSLSAELTEQVANAGRAVAAAWSVGGLFGVDFVVRGGCPFIVEVNPRPTASHELHELAQPDLPGHVSLQLGRSTQQCFSVTGVSEPIAQAAGSGHRRERRGCWARFVIYADQDSVIGAAMETELLTHCVGDRDGASHNFWLADIPSADTAILKGTPLCSLYVDLSTKDPRFSALRPLPDLLPLSTALPVNELVETIRSQLVVLANH
ncbi:MAG TPA: ATP-grasp domain-containing protein [Planctomycetes bacterium]|nr:ATP-grasp domain-containing protein [Fuerstiella sp.]HIK93797.1 ATP-grasp domain-containing protein [Planctomycetota bacterium]